MGRFPRKSSANSVSRNRPGPVNDVSDYLSATWLNRTTFGGCFRVRRDYFTAGCCGSIVGDSNLRVPRAAFTAFRFAATQSRLP